MASTIFDVLDNFFKDDQVDVRRVPGRDLAELGEHVRLFASSVDDKVSAGSQGMYLGGWPSASFWAVGGDLLLSSLLYADHVVVRDPLMDWFTSARYEVEHLAPSRGGYLRDSGTFDALGTRVFLDNVLPALYAWRPLIESGVVKTVRGEELVRANSQEISELEVELATRLLEDPLSYAENFAPSEVATEDNVRGFFVAAGGERAAQLAKFQRYGLRYFARELTLAQSSGATYTAPFAHEQFLCREGLAAVLPPSQRVVRALLQSELPVLSGLTPRVINKIHADDGFATFRAKLHEVYAGLPEVSSPAETRAYLRDQEQALLSPVLERTERDVARGPIGRLGVALAGEAFSIAGGVAAGIIAGDPEAAVAAAVVGEALNVGRRVTKGKAPGDEIWRELVRHRRTVRDEVRWVKEASAAHPGPAWGIPEEPSMSVTVLQGWLLWDSAERPGQFDANGAPNGYTEGVYQPCDCKSGLKFKFCCNGV